MTLRTWSCLLALVAMTATGLAQQPPQTQTPPSGGQGQGRGGQGGQRQPQGDRPPTPAGTSAIGGRVLTADTSRPVKRARVMVSGGRGGRTATTDDQGRYRITDLNAGSYTVTAAKNGFVDAVFGQRRPLQPGTPVQLADAQEASNVDLRLTRGGVVTGRVVDEDGEPLARAMVTVQRYQYVRGERQLSPAGGDQTDDRGQYRVFGLAQGDYYVSATANGLGLGVGRGLQLQQLAAEIAALGGGRGGRGGLGVFGAAGQPEPTGYAPTYYPGVVAASDAGKITVAPGQEVIGIDFQIQLVPFATVSGMVAGADDVVPVLLVPQDTGAGPLGGQTFTGRSRADGTFSIANVPPGRYTAVARSGGRGGDPKVGTQSIVVNGQDLGGVMLTMQSGGTLSGSITVESSGTPAPTDYSSFRVDAPEVIPLPLGGGGRGGLFGADNRAEKNGGFRISNLLPGRHYIRVTGQASGQAQWNLKEVTAGGQDVTESIDLKPGQNVDSVTIVLTDRTTDVAGTVRDAKGDPMSAMTVVAFSSDSQYWRAQSRRIQAARTDQTGAYHLRNLPPGDYFVIAVDDVEQGEWFDPGYLERMREGAKRLTLSEGEQKTQDLTGPAG